MVRFLSLIVMFFFCFVTSAAEISVEVTPKEPVAGEVFQLSFTIEANEKVDPYISFDPGKASVQGRRNIGTSIQTTIINGAVETKRSSRYVYDLIVEDPGKLVIRDIQVDIDGEVHRHKTLTVDILREAKEAKGYFLRAEISDSSLFIGQGATVNYYLYFRVPVVGTEIREFPKLNSFIKRFHMPPERVETVEVSGMLYRRKLMYSARVYPEKVGELVIDPLRMKLQYSSESSGTSPFSSFGFNSRQTQVRNLQSKELKVDVSPVPVDNMPKDFTGLVGKHEFNLTYSKERFLTNEPIEYTLTVRGPGALENLNAPKILEEAELEEFDTKSEFTELDKIRGEKTFEYTYLARAAFEREEKEITFSFFDPETESFERQSVKLPRLEVVATGALTRNEEAQSEKGESPTDMTKELISVRTGLIAPIWEPLGTFHFKRSPYRLFIVFIFLLSLGILIEQTYKHKHLIFPKTEYEKILKLIYKNGVTYKHLFAMFDEYRIRTGQTDRKMDQLIDDLDLETQEKVYFKKLVGESEKAAFKDNLQVVDHRVNKKYFYKLIKKFEQAHNDHL